MSTKLKAGTATSGAVIDADTSGILELQSGSTPTTAITVNSSQQVGIGTNSPSYPLSVQSASATNGIAAQFTNTGSTGAGIDFLQSGVDNFSLTMPAGTGGLRFIASGSNERMRIDSSGNLLVAGASFNANGSVCIGPIGTSANGCTAVSASTASTNIWRFYNPNGNVGGIATNASATFFNTSSDYRLKENIAPMQNALKIVQKLKPVTYTWKVDGSAGQGFIAHELAEICPEAVNGEKDAINEDGSINPQGIDPSKIIGILTAAIQELNAKVTALEEQVINLGVK